jgi:hypothetical protein
VGGWRMSPASRRWSLDLWGAVGEEEEDGGGGESVDVASCRWRVGRRTGGPGCSGARESVGMSSRCCSGGRYVGTRMVGPRPAVSPAGIDPIPDVWAGRRAACACACAGVAAWDAAEEEEAKALQTSSVLAAASDTGRSSNLSLWILLSSFLFRKAIITDIRSSYHVLPPKAYLQMCLCWDPSAECHFRKGCLVL